MFPRRLAQLFGWPQKRRGGVGGESTADCVPAAKVLGACFRPQQGGRPVIRLDRLVAVVLEGGRTPASTASRLARHEGRRICVSLAVGELRVRVRGHVDAQKVLMPYLRHQQALAGE